MSISGWLYVGFGVVSLVLAVERLWRFRRQPVTLNHVGFTITLCALSLAAIAYGTMGLTSAYWNVGLGVWHALVAVLIGGVELLMLTLRHESFKPRWVRVIAWRCAIVTCVLVATWLIGFAQAGPIYDLSQSAPRNPATIIHLIVFPAYIVWGLLKIVLLSIERVRVDWGRRSISVVALLMICGGAVGFIWLNVIITIYLFIDRDFSTAELYTGIPVYLTLCLGGAALLAGGERLYDELSARYRLRKLRPLWMEMLDQLPEDLHLEDHRMNSTAQLQRAYVEISDAMCLLRLDTEELLSVSEVARRLRQGDLSEQPEDPTISQALPPRRTRRSDLEMIHRLADAFRRALPAGA